MEQKVVEYMTKPEVQELVREMTVNASWGAFEMICAVVGLLGGAALFYIKKKCEEDWSAAMTTRNNKVDLEFKEQEKLITDLRIEVKGLESEHK